MRWRVLTTILTVVLLVACAAGDDGGAVAEGGGEAAATETATGDGDAGETRGERTEPAGDPAEEVSEALPDRGDLVVVSTVTPVADAVARVLGDRGRVETLIPAGADSHTYEPRPQDVAVLESADAFLGVGLGLNDASLRLAQANLPRGAAIVLLGDEALAAGNLVLDHGHSHDDDGHSHSHDDDGHSHSHDDDGQGHEDGDDPGPNPHVWTSVRNVMRLVDRAAEALADLDPGGAPTYTANAQGYLAELRELDEALAEAVGTIPEGGRKLVVYHDAWVYFGRDYGLEVVAAVQPSDFSEPSAADIRAIIDQIRAEQVPAVFGSEEFRSDVLAAIADETGAQYVGDIADDTLPGDPGDPEHSYVGMMVRSATAIVEALGGDPQALDGSGSSG